MIIDWRGKELDLLYSTSVGGGCRGEAPVHKPAKRLNIAWRDSRPSPGSPAVMCSLEPGGLLSRRPRGGVRAPVSTACSACAAGIGLLLLNQAIRRNGLRPCFHQGVHVIHATARRALYTRFSLPRMVARFSSAATIERIRHLALGDRFAQAETTRCSACWSSALSGEFRTFPPS